MKRIVDQFYTLDDAKDCSLNSELVSTLKDTEMYTNIYSKRSLDSEAVSKIKHWIYHLSAQKCQDEEEKLQRNRLASQLKESVMFKKLNSPFHRDPQGFDQSNFKLDDKKAEKETQSEINKSSIAQERLRKSNYIIKLGERKYSRKHTNDSIKVDANAFNLI
jgi:predicted S18 family serine protease